MATLSDPTFGMRAVGLSFNPSGDPKVHECKVVYAHLIDMLDDLRGRSTDPEVKRLASVTITELQGAQMWHVKTLTWGK